MTSGTRCVIIKVQRNKKTNLTKKRRKKIMARVRMVTRTVVVTGVQVMCLEVTKAEVQVKNYELSGTYESNEVILKALKKLYETDTFKVVAVQEVDEKEVLYGMEEIDFIRLARVLPPRGSKEAQEEEE